MTVQIQLRRGTAAQWTAANPTMAAGEMGLETDTGKIKMGDGTTAWNSLGYFSGVPSGAAGGDLSGTYPNPNVQDNSHAHDNTSVTTHSTAHTHASTTGQTANDHHNQSHDHSAAGDGQTLSPATLVVPASATPAQTAEGSAVWDSDDDRLTIGTGASRKTLMNTDTGVVAAQMPALTGDVTTSAGAVATTIAARAVTAAKLFAASATSRILGRKTAGSGDWEELTGADVAAMLDVAEDADIQRVGVANAAGSNTTEFAMAGHIHQDQLFDSVVNKGSNQDVTNSAVLVDDTALQFATNAANAYYVEIFLAYELQSGSAADLKVVVGEDASIRGAFHYTGISAAEAAQEGVIAADQTATAAFGGTANMRLAVLRGVYRGNGGTFKVRWAQNTATVGVYTRVRSGSFLRYRTF